MILMCMQFLIFLTNIFQVGQVAHKYKPVPRPLGAFHLPGVVFRQYQANEIA